MRSRIGNLVRGARGLLINPILYRLNRDDPPKPDAAAQLQLQMMYRSMLHRGEPLPRPSDVGFRAYSQTNEDGILLYLFAILGTTRKTCVEICAGDGIECNTTNLILNHGWTGLLVDGNPDLVERGREFFRNSPNTGIYPPDFVHSWVNRDNIDDLIGSHGLEGEVDLLSIDLDGVDYWIWDAIGRITPRVVVVEYQDILGPDRSWTVPYSDTFSARDYPTTDGLFNFCGASLSAMVKLGRRKGYRLAGINQYGFNAFFARDDLGSDSLPEIDPHDCFWHPKVVWGMRERFPTVAGLPWVEV